MCEFDDYITYYMQRNFQSIKADLIPRDYELEEKINLISRIEYALETSIENIKKIFDCKCRACKKDQIEIDVQIKNGCYTIFSMHNFFSHVTIKNLPYRPTLCTLLDIPQKHYYEFPVPIFALYMEYTGKTLDEAIVDLQSLAQSNDKVNKNVQLYPAFNRKITIMGCVFLYYTPDNQYKCACMHSIYFYSQKRKILVPACFL